MAQVAWLSCAACQAWANMQSQGNFGWDSKNCGDFYHFFRWPFGYNLLPFQTMRNSLVLDLLVKARFEQVVIKVQQFQAWARFD